MRKNDGPVMLVEDNLDDIILTKRAFKKARLENELIIFKDGVEALDYLLGRGDYAERTDKTAPVVILLDLKLPRLNGLEVLQQIRANDKTRRIPVIILTTSREEQDLAQAYDLNVNSYIVKPIDFNQFVDAVQQIGLYWLVMNEVPDDDTTSDNN